MSKRKYHKQKLPVVYYFLWYTEQWEPMGTWDKIVSALIEDYNYNVWKKYIVFSWLTARHCDMMGGKRIGYQCYSRGSAFCLPNGRWRYFGQSVSAQRLQKNNTARHALNTIINSTIFSKTIIEKKIVFQNRNNYTIFSVQFIE